MYPSSQKTFGEKYREGEGENLGGTNIFLEIFGVVSYGPYQFEEFNIKAIYNFF